MSPVREASLTALREIRRNIASTKGIAMFVLFFLGGLLGPIIGERVIIKLLFGGDLTGLTAVEKQQVLNELLLRSGYERATVDYLSFCPWQLGILFFQGTLTFAPLLILLIGFDQIVGDIQHRAVRYIAGRSRRESIVVGKALGVWAVIAFLMLILNVTVWILMIGRGVAGPAAILTWGPRLWLLQVAAAAAWVGLITLISSLFRTPIIALLAGAVVFPGVWLTNKILGLIEAAAPAMWALPFKYEDLLISPEPLRVLGGVGAFIGWGAVMVAIATQVVKRRDV
jgi:ABC-type transport system involved in multi-copper enzyme maturation permease subunit